MAISYIAKLEELNLRAVGISARPLSRFPDALDNKLTGNRERERERERKKEKGVECLREPNIVCFGFGAEIIEC